MNIWGLWSHSIIFSFWFVYMTCIHLLSSTKALAFIILYLHRSYLQEANCSLLVLQLKLKYIYLLFASASNLHHEYINVELKLLEGYESRESKKPLKEKLPVDQEYSHFKIDYVALPDGFDCPTSRHGKYKIQVRWKVGEG